MKSKKKDNHSDSPELAAAEAQVEAISAELTVALRERAVLPKTATDEEKDASAERVERLQTRQHDAVQHVLAIKRQESAKLEHDHKEKKQQRKRLKASQQADTHESPYEDPDADSHWTAQRPPQQRPQQHGSEQIDWDAAEPHDRHLEQKRQEEEEEGDSEEVARQRRAAEKKRKKDESAQRREAKKRTQADALAKAEAQREQAEHEKRAASRKEDSLRRKAEAKSERARKRAEAEGRPWPPKQRTGSSTGWLAGIMRTLRNLFGSGRE